MSKIFKKYKIGVGLSVALVLLVALLLSFVNVKAEPITDQGADVGDTVEGSVNVKEGEADKDKSDDGKSYEDKIADFSKAVVKVDSSCANDKKDRPNCTVTKARERYDVKAVFSDKDRTATLSAAKGKYKVVAMIGDTNNKTNYTLNAGTKLKIQVPESGNLEVLITVKLSEDDSDSSYCRAGCYVENFTHTFNEQVSSVENVHYDGICKSFRESYVPSRSAEEQAKLKELVPYCFNTSVDSVWPEATVKQIIETAKTIAKLNYIAGGKISDPTGYTYVDPSKTNISKLTCDAWSPNINEKKYYTKKVVKNNSVCSVTCQEKFKVKYDAPTSVVGGQCFTYSVQVESKVDCESKIKKAAPEEPKICNPYPICNGYAGYAHQGGPKEEFDACVSSCDNGNYSQKCINKCYKKVYGTSNKVKTTAIDIGEYVADKTASTCGKVNKNNIKSVMKYKAEYPGGKYDWSGNGIIWKYDSSYGDLCGLPGAVFYYQSYYYTRRMLTGSDYPNRYAGPYVVDSKGFRRATYCHEHCRYVGCSKKTKDGKTVALNAKAAAEQYQKELAAYNRKLEACSSVAKCESKTATYHMEVDVYQNGEKTTIKYDASNRPNNDGKSASTQTNTDDIIRDYGGPCYGKSSSEYDYMTKINFPGTWKNLKTGKIVWKNPNNVKYAKIGKDNSFCVPENIDDMNSLWWVWDVKSRIDNGGNRIKATDAVKNSIGKLKQNIHAKITKFGLFGWGVNIDCFYATYRENEGDDPKCTESGGCTTCKKGDCPNTCTNNNGLYKCTCVRDCTETKTDVTNIAIRTVDNSNLFPNSTVSDPNTNINIKKLSYENKEDGLLKLSDSREIGFNWNCNATNLNNSNYPIAPTILKGFIEETNQNKVIAGGKTIEGIYAEDYLDYAFKLSRQQISDIRRDYKNKKYGEFEGATKRVQNGVYVYQSSLISSLSGRKNAVIGENSSYIKCTDSRCSNLSDACINAKRAEWTAAKQVKQLMDQREKRL